MTNDVFVSQRGLYSVGPIPTLDPDFGSRLQDLISLVGVGRENTQYSSPVCLTVWLVGACYDLSVRTLWLVAVHSCLVMKKMIPVEIWIQTSQFVLHLVGEM